jgi:23S rRNA (guanine745-N1)-methyltransferase
MSLRHAMRQNFAASFVAMGALIVVTPAWDHLTELVAALGLLQVEPSKPDRVAGALSGYLAKQEHTTHTKQLQLLHADVLTLVEMGPNAWHTHRDALLDRIRTFPVPVSVTASVDLAVYRPT